MEARCEERGFSLVETVVAILVLAIGALAAATLQMSATRANQLSLNRQIATNLARQLLEAVETKAFGSPDLATTPGTAYASPSSALNGTNPLNAQGLDTGTGRIFTRRWRVLTTGAGGASTINYKEIRVRVSWNQSGQGHTVELVTIKGWNDAV